MAQPVWILSVDLQTKTATFQTGMADAAKAARGSFNDIKSGASEMGAATSVSMMETRESVMLVGEEFGVHLPRALSRFIAGLGPIGPALEAAFPFIAIAALAGILIEHLEKMREAGLKLTEDQYKFGTTINNTWNALDEKILQAQIRSDELRNDHLGALRLQLELLDKESLSELVHSFEEVAKAADVVMKDLEGHWYTFGTGSTGAKAALDDFQTKYEALLAAGKGEQASGLLHGTTQQAQTVLSLLQQAQGSMGGSGNGDYGKFEEAKNKLRAMGVDLENQTTGTLRTQIAAQQNLVDALNAQVGSEQRIAELKKLEGGNDQTQLGNDASAKKAAGARQAAESTLRINEETLAADRAAAESSLSIHRATLEQRLASDIEFADRDRDIKLAANAAEIAALDKSGKDYQNQLQALNDKTLEIGVEHDTKVAELRSKASVEMYDRDLRDLEQSERDKIDATQEGSAARLAAIDAAMKEEQSRNLQDTSFYRELLNQRVQLVRQMSEEEAKLKADAAREEADNDEKMGLLAIAAERQRMELEDSTRRASVQKRIAEDTQLANEENTLKMAALQKEIDGLDKLGKDYLVKLKQLQDEEKQLTQAHENELAAIREKAEIDTNNKLAASYQQFTSTISGELSKTIMGHQSMAKMVESLGDEMISSLLKNAIQYAMSNKFRQESDAKAAASAGFKLGMEIGGPAAPVLAPLFAAVAFAGAMAFETGTDRVPGVGRGDVVPTMLTPGEGVVPGGVMDGLRNMARNGGFDQRPAMTVHVRPTYNVNTIDGDGMKATLEKHTDQLQRHFENTLRRMNH